MRSHYCGEVNSRLEGKEVSITGWVHRRRDHGGVIFVDLRDRYGTTQLVFNMEINTELCHQARTLGREDVIQIEGNVIARASINKDMNTGDIEVDVYKLSILNKSKTPLSSA